MERIAAARRASAGLPGARSLEEGCELPPAEEASAKPSWLRPDSPGAPPAAEKSAADRPAWLRQPAASTPMGRTAELEAAVAADQAALDALDAADAADLRAAAEAKAAAGAKAAAEAKPAQAEASAKARKLKELKEQAAKATAKAKAFSERELAAGVDLPRLPAPRAAPTAEVAEEVGAAPLGGSGSFDFWDAPKGPTAGAEGAASPPESPEPLGAAGAGRPPPPVPRVAYTETEMEPEVSTESDSGGEGEQAGAVEGSVPWELDGAVAELEVMPPPSNSPLSLSASVSAPHPPSHAARVAGYRGGCLRRCHCPCLRQLPFAQFGWWQRGAGADGGAGGGAGRRGREGGG
jgi:hypothetical protein